MENELDSIATVKDAKGCNRKEYYFGSKPFTEVPEGRTSHEENAKEHILAISENLQEKNEGGASHEENSKEPILVPSENLQEKNEGGASHEENSKEPILVPSDDGEESCNAGMLHVEFVAESRHTTSFSGNLQEKNEEETFHEKNIEEPISVTSGNLKDKNEGGASYDEKSKKSMLAPSFTPLDDVYIKNAENNVIGDILFLDALGAHDAVEVDSSPSDPIVVDVSDLSDPSIDSMDVDDDFQCQNYRDGSDGSASDLSSSESDSDIEIEMEEIFRKGPHLNKCHGVTTHGELTLKDLPLIEDLKIRVPEEECQKIGSVSSIVNELVVIQAMPNTPALDLGTILFLDSGKESLGEIFDVFGQVKEPYYTVRFNSEEHARSRGVKEGVEVFCAPKTEYTSFVFLYEMLKIRGSDASWEHNHEPPLHCLDYSDDEQEKLARKKSARAFKKGEPSSKNDEVDSESISVMDSDEETTTGSSSGVSESMESTRPNPWQSPSLANGSRNRNPFSPNGIVHWRQILPNAMTSCLPDASMNRPANLHFSVPESHACHPPGHPPIRAHKPSRWMESELALKAARRVSQIPFRVHSSVGLLPTPTLHALSLSANSHHVPTIHTPSLRVFHPLALNSNSTQGPRAPLLPTPGPMRLQQHHRPPLLPSPSSNPWAISCTARAVIPVASLNSTSQTRFRIPPADSRDRYVTPSLFNPSGPRCPIQHRPPPELLMHRSGPLIATQPFPSSHQIAPEFNTFVRRDSFPPALLPPSQPPFITGERKPFILRPSSLFSGYSGQSKVPSNSKT